MQSTRARSMRAILFAVIVGAAGASPAFAAEASSTVSESLTVQAYVSLTGVPATIAYGTSIGGDVKSGGTFELTAATNNAAGLRIEVAASDLTTGGGTIPKSNRAFVTPATFATACNWTGASHVAECFVPSGGAYVEDGGGRMVIGQSSDANTRKLLVEPQVSVPASAPAGNYAGSFTVYAVTK